MPTAPNPQLILSIFSACLLWVHQSFGQCEPVYTLSPPTAGNLFGRSVANIGDVDSDRIDDFAVGAPGNDGNGQNSGAIFVYSGATGALIRTIFGNPSNGVGERVAPAGDLDADGVGDILSFQFFNVRAFSGASGDLIHLVQSPTLDTFFGLSMTPLDDVNADSHNDFAVADHWFANPFGVRTGRVYVYSGADANLIYSIDGLPVNHQLGHSIGKVGDLDGDSIDDLIIGAANPNNLAVPDIHVCSGANGKVIHAITIANPLGLIAKPERVRGMGDVNGDGLPDIAVLTKLGLPFSPYQGSIYSGLDGSLLQIVAIPSDADGTVAEGPGNDPKLDLAVLNDVTGDGVQDLVLGAGYFSPGRAFVCSGSDGSFFKRFRRPVTPPPVANDFGYAVAAVDIDGDGADEVIVGAPIESSVGRVHVYRVFRQADVNCDRAVNVGDLLLLVYWWGSFSCCSPPSVDVAPPVGNGAANIEDLLSVIADWGQ